MSFADARAQMNLHSNQITAAAKQTEARQDLAAAAKTLHRPLLSADLSVLDYEKSGYASTAGAQALINSAISYTRACCPTCRCRRACRPSPCRT